MHCELCLTGSVHRPSCLILTLLQPIPYELTLHLIAASANGFDGSLVNCLQAIPEWQQFLHTPTGAWLGFISAVYWIAMLACFTITASISNRFGRKVGLYIGLVLVFIGAAIQAAATNTAVFVVARAILGFSAGFWGSTAPVLISEIALPSHREVATGCYQCGFFVGGTVAAFVTLGSLYLESSWSWRIPSLFQVFLPLLLLPGVIMAPQSPRWLVSRGRHEEARQTIAKWHAGGDSSAPIVIQELREIEEAIKMESSMATTSYLDLVRGPGNRKRLFVSLTLGMFSQWGGNGVASYYLTPILISVGVTDADKQLVITGCLQVWNLVCATGAAACIKRLGKRTLFLSSASIMFVSFILITALSASFANTQYAAAGIAVIPFIFTFSMGYAIAL